MRWAELEEKVEPFNKKAYELALEIPRDTDGNPLTLEGAIRHMILCHPNLVDSRSRALDLLYCVLGTGIDWNDDGRLVDMASDNYLQLTNSDAFTLMYNISAQFTNMVSKEIIYDMETRLFNRYCNEINQFGFRLEKIDEVCQRVVPIRWYPYAEISNLETIPHNVQSDFKAGAEEVHTLREENAKYTNI